MSSRRNFALGVISCLILITLAVDECDQTQCRGPLKYYKDLNCKPIFKTPGDCCPEQFDCDHLKNRPVDKCRIENYDYNIGDRLRAEHGNPCDIECMCIESNGIAQFTCAAIDCPQWPINNTCYEPQKATECCGGQIICPEKPEDRSTCEVDGKIYKDGEYFKPSSEPEKDCYCGPGYQGDNVEPFCITSNHECGSELHHAYDIYHKCAPVYYSSQSPQKDCSLSFRCQNKRDEIIKRDTNEESKNQANHENVTCEFGNMVMHHGDELNQATNYESVCVKCICEVGPVLTCQRLPDNECDVTNHPDFNTEEYQ